MSTGVFRRPPPTPSRIAFAFTAPAAPTPTSILQRPVSRVEERARFEPSRASVFFSDRTAGMLPAPSLPPQAGPKQTFFVHLRRVWVPSAPPAPAASLLLDPAFRDKERLVWRARWRHPEDVQAWVHSRTPPAVPTLLWDSLSRFRRVLVAEPGVFRPRWVQPPFPQLWIGGPAPTERAFVVIPDLGAFLFRLNRVRLLHRSIDDTNLDEFAILPDVVSWLSNRVRFQHQEIAD